MAEYQLTPDQRCLALTVSHRDEFYAAQDNTVENPRYLNWKAASELEEFMADFQWELMRLEALLYAVCGATPKSYANNEQWYLHSDPRCLWPEQEFEHSHNATSPRTDTYTQYYWQTAARGRYGTETEGGSEVADTGYVDWPRSEDLPAHYSRRSHDSTWFPVGCLTRTEFETNYRDPLPDEDVTITWAVPAALKDRIDTVTIYWRVIHGSTTPTSTNNNAMATTDEGATYSYTISGQDEQTIVLFAIKVITNDETPQTIWEPRGTSEPVWTWPKGDPVAWDYLFTNVEAGEEHQAGDPEDCYYVSWFTHSAPYEHGLPELLWQYQHPEMRRCTGTWRLSRIEHVTAGLINVARFALDAFGRKGFQHDPRNRGEAPGCCFDMPVGFRWSGAARFPHFQDGGKELGLPITNNIEEASAGYEMARMYWRGVPAIYTLSTSMGGRSLLYGRDESWKSWPIYSKATCSAIYGDGWGDSAWHRVFDTCGRYRGLRPDDRVTVDHIREIIAAVQYLCDTNGIWFTRAINTCKATPSSCFPLQDYVAPGEFIRYNRPSNNLEEVYFFDGTDLYCDPGESPEESDPYEEPTTIEQCNEPPAEGCVVAGATEWLAYYQSFCDKPVVENGDNVEWYECGCHRKGLLGTYNYTLHVEQWDSFQAQCGVGGDTDENVWPGNSTLAGSTLGYAYYLCGPVRYWNPVGTDRVDNTIDDTWNRVDDDHGNLYHKDRGDYCTCGTYGWFTGASMGNNSDLAVSCHTERTFEQDVYHKEVSFEGITKIQFAGLGTKWAKRKAPDCDCDWNEIDDIVPSLKGFGYYGYPDTDGVREPLCDFTDEDQYTGTNYTNTIDPVENVPPEGLAMDTGDCPTGFHSRFVSCAIKRDNIAWAWSVLNEDGTVDITDGSSVVGYVDLDTNTVHYSWGGGYTWRLDYTYQCDIDTSVSDCEITTNSTPNCSPSSPMVYLRVDLNKDGSGIPQLKDHDLGITGTGGIYPDTVIPGTAKTYGGAYTPCIDGEPT